MRAFELLNERIGGPDDELFPDPRAELLHLGGGRGSQEDGLYRFKAGFSDRDHPVRVMKFICDQAEYDRLTANHASESGNTPSELVDSGFFPAYRAVPS